MAYSCSLSIPSLLYLEIRHLVQRTADDEPRHRHGGLEGEAKGQEQRVARIVKVLVADAVVRVQKNHEVLVGQAGRGVAVEEEQKRERQGGLADRRGCKESQD